MFSDEAAALLEEYHGLTAPVLGTDTFAACQIGDTENGVYTFYVFFNKPFASGDTVMLFDTITVDKAWDNAEMKELKELSITVQAYATQAYGFDDCFTAITTAFPTEFPFN